MNIHVKFFGSILFLLSADWITKYLFYDLQVGSDSLWLTPFLNTGIAWSLPVPQWIVFVVGVSLVLGVLYLWLKPTASDDISNYYWPLIFFVAGAVGNLLDRVFYGGVRDFIDLQIWPIFNGADSFLTIAVVFLLLIECRGWFFQRSSD